MDEQSTANDASMSDAPDASDSLERRLELAMRVLAWQSDIGGAGGAVIRLLPGRLPADLPLSLPLPEGARIAGAMTRAQSSAPPTTTILVDAPLSPEHCAQFYTERLEALGWRFQIHPTARGGFVYVQSGGSFLLRFVTGAGDDALVIAIRPGATQGEAALSIMALKDESAKWQRRGMGPDQARTIEALIPPLMPPPGASQQGSGGGGGQGRWRMNAQMETELPVAEVIAHYDRQLEHGGWRRRSGDASGPVGWSFWSFADTTDTPWRGAFLALTDPDRPRHYILLVEIEMASESDQPGGGFTTYGTLTGR